MSSRFDNRSVSAFKKQIKFSTMLEKYFFNKWLDVVKNTNSIKVSSWGDNGCGNDGEFIAKGNTAGADYKVTGSFSSPLIYPDTVSFEDHPLEVKWVPTSGKFTLKEGDLKAYIKEGASILFIYNSVNCGTNLRLPKEDYDLAEHIKKIESKEGQIKWGIMWSTNVEKFYKNAKDNNLIKPIHYMGGKQGVVLQQRDFDKWFTQEEWKHATNAT
jgi:hypothetical protein